MPISSNVSTLLSFAFRLDFTSTFGFFTFYISRSKHWRYFPLIMLYIGSLGFIFSNSVSLTLEFFPNISASANAIIGVLQYSMGALIWALSQTFCMTERFFPVMGVMMGVSL